jgi:hypothetical protein
MPDVSILDLLKEIRAMDPSATVIVYIAEWLEGRQSSKQEPSEVIDC